MRAGSQPVRDLWRLLSGAGESRRFRLLKVCVWSGLGVLALFLNGCITKAKADAQARAAFQAGQQQAVMRLQQLQGAGPCVIFTGAVRRSVVPWTAGLTLAQAVVAADYYGPEPEKIIVVRAGRAIVCDPHKLLAGEDVSLQPGDVVQLNAAPGQAAPPTGPPPAQVQAPGDPVPADREALQNLFPPR